MTQQAHEIDPDIGPLVQLQAFADFEVLYRPDPNGRKHITQWAVEEIERLHRIASQLSVIATKHCPQEHHDWQRLLDLAREL
jgi:hypothetical protein